MTTTRQNILFICTHNSCRSQIAEGLGNYLYGNLYSFYSAGTKATIVDPLAVKIMKEIDIDISMHHSKTINEIGNIDFNYVITVCNNAEKNCPVIPAKTQRIHIAFQDPPALAKNFSSIEEKLNCYRKVREEIKSFIIDFHKNYLHK